jgi:putative nucleotidyltransferase with HDIG domain
MLSEKYNKKELLNINEITIEKLKAGELVDKLPEIYELKEVIENNNSHINQSVFDHTISVMENLEKLIDENSKKQLLILAATFHDIGKKETIVEKEGKISCPGHELASAKKMPNILERFNLSPAEKDYIIRVISNHGRLHDLMSGVSRENLEAEYEKIKAEIKDIIYEILLLTEADMMGGDLEKINQNEYSFRMDFYNKEIKELNL